MKFPAAAFSVVVALCLAIASARCARADGPEHQHPPQDAPIHEQFYMNWMRPDNQFQSCCNLKDCAPADGVRFEGGKWQARPRGGDWITIPPEKIERNRDSPDGRAHLCIIGFTVICFVHGAGT